MSTKTVHNNMREGRIREEYVKILFLSFHVGQLGEKTSNWSTSTFLSILSLVLDEYQSNLINPKFFLSSLISYSSINTPSRPLTMGDVSYLFPRFVCSFIFRCRAIGWIEGKPFFSMTVTKIISWSDLFFNFSFVCTTYFFQIMCM